MNFYMYHICTQVGIIMGPTAVCWSIAHLKYERYHIDYTHGGKN